MIPDDVQRGMVPVPPGSSISPRARYEALAASALREACSASLLSATELVTRIRTATGESVLPSRLEEWQVGEREFPAWIMPAIAGIAGLQREEGRWVLRNHQDQAAWPGTPAEQDPAGSQWLRYRLEAANILRAVCGASFLPAADLAGALQSTTGQPIHPRDLERWQRGDDDFPAWIVPAVVEVGGSDDGSDYWAQAAEPGFEDSIDGPGEPRRGRRRAIEVGVAGVALGALAWAAWVSGARDLLLPDRSPRTSFAAPRMPSPTDAMTPAVDATPGPTSAPIQSPPTPPLPPPAMAAAPAPTRAAPTPAPATPAAPTPAPTSHPTPSPTRTPPSTTPTPSPTQSASGGVIGGVINLLGL